MQRFASGCILLFKSFQGSQENMKIRISFVFLLMCWAFHLAQAESVMLRPKFLFEFGKRGMGAGEFGGDDNLQHDGIQGPVDVAVDYGRNPIYTVLQRLLC